MRRNVRSEKAKYAWERQCELYIKHYREQKTRARLVISWLCPPFPQFITSQSLSLSLSHPPCLVYCHRNTFVFIHLCSRNHFSLLRFLIFGILFTRKISLSQLSLLLYIAMPLHCHSLALHISHCVWNLQYWSNWARKKSNRNNNNTSLYSIGVTPI